LYSPYSTQLISQSKNFLKTVILSPVPISLIVTPDSAAVQAHHSLDPKPASSSIVLRPFQYAFLISTVCVILISPNLAARGGGGGSGPLIRVARTGRRKQTRRGQFVLLLAAHALLFSLTKKIPGP
jgi:hypothetical protein